ncbi:hypothetical protein [Pseudonocardia sp. GCM10023141]|uniref:hypothetical protein n=1 Tax=Pseudonocardia sp. GCM10023141 TaxID=3252653 RepID=UPI00361298DF
MARRAAVLRPDEPAPLLGSHIVRVTDLEELRIGRSTVAARCRAGGPWRRLLPGIVALHNGPPTRDDRRRAALLYAGPGAVLTGLDALQPHGMERMPSPSGPVHLLVPADRRRVGAGRVLVERTENLPVAELGRWPLAPIQRVALDFTRRTSDRNEVRSALAEVVQRGRCTPAQLNAELAAGSGRGSALPRLVLEEISDGVRSVAEANARRLVLRSGLPAPMWNAKLYDRNGLFIAMPDAWFDDVGMAWQIDSKEWHLSPDDYERTADTRSAMMIENILVVHTVPSKMAARGDDVIAELQANHRHAGLRPRPPVMAIPQP